MRFTPSTQLIVKQFLWITLLVAFLMFVAVAELFWGHRIHDLMLGGKISRERAAILASYHRKADAGLLPKPADADALEMFLPEKDSLKLAIRVRSQSGEILEFHLVRPGDGSSTNWEFRPSRAQFSERQIQAIKASYYRRAAGGLVPMPANTNAIRIFPGAVAVTSADGTTNWFFLLRPIRGTGTNWGFQPPL